MDWNTLFIWANMLVMPAWVLLWTLPDSNLTQRLVYSFWYPLLLGGTYAFLLGYALQQSGDMSMDALTTIDGLQALFSGPAALVTGWLHYLLFDLFTGMWIARDALRLGIPKGIVFLPLLFTLMAGPIGLLLYLGIRYYYTRSVTY